MELPRRGHRPARSPARLPTLFALDAALAIPGGYRYVLTAKLLGADRGDTHCATAIGCGSSCGSLVRRGRRRRRGWRQLEAAEAAGRLSQADPADQPEEVAT